jgi:hypothetical protein
MTEPGKQIPSIYTLAKILVASAWSHNLLELELGPSEQVPSVFVQSVTIPPFLMRQCVLKITHKFIKDVKMPLIISNYIINRVILEFKYAVLERFRCWKVVSARKTIFDKVFIMLLTLS